MMKRAAVMPRTMPPKEALTYLDVNNVMRSKLTFAQTMTPERTLVAFSARPLRTKASPTMRELEQNFTSGINANGS